MAIKGWLGACVAICIAWMVQPLAAQSPPGVPTYTVPSGVDQLPPPPDAYLNAPAMPSAQQLPPPRPASNPPPFINGVPAESPAAPPAPTTSVIPAESALAKSVNAPTEATPVERIEAPWWSPSVWGPSNWFPVGWNNSFEAGLNGSEGNSQSMSFLVGTKLKRATEVDTFNVEINHRHTEANSVETQNNAFLGSDYDHLIGTSAWSWFAKQGVEYDEFKAFDVRYNVNAGLGYHWIKEPNMSLITRFGAGTSREIGGPDDEWKPEAVFGVESNYQVNQRNKVYGKIEYLPQWDNFSDYRYVSDVGWEMLVDEQNNLSLKIGATNRYDSTPNGRKASDLNYALLLLYKF